MTISEATRGVLLEYIKEIEGNIKAHRSVVETLNRRIVAEEETIAESCALVAQLRADAGEQTNGQAGNTEGA